MVKARKTHQPRDWQKKTGFRSASGFISALPDVNSGKVRKEHIRTHVEIREQARGKKDKFQKVKGIGKTFDVTELQIPQQIQMVRRSLKKMYRRLKRHQEIIAKNQNNDIGAEYYGKAQITQDLINEKLLTIARLEEKLKSRDKAGKTKEENEKKESLISKEKTNSFVSRLEKQGYYEELRKKRLFSDANAKLEGNLKVDPKEIGKSHKRFSQQPRKDRNQNEILVIIKKRNDKNVKQKVVTNTTTVNKNVNKEEKSVFRKKAD